jgi:hypothetical protein
MNVQVRTCDGLLAPPTGTGEPLAGLLRPGNAGSNTATDHIEVFDAALVQLPARLREPDERGGRAVLVEVKPCSCTAS